MTSSPTPDHSPLPWRWTPCETEGNDIVSGAMLWHGDHRSVFTVDCGEWYGLSDADAEFIVRACNAHDELLAALKELHAIVLDGMQADYDDMTAALGRGRVAIAKAEGR